jgi:hypothetical protein
MEGWPYAASCFALLGDNNPAGVICTVTNGPYCLPCRTGPPALAAAAQLRVDGISSCYLNNHPS